MLLVAAIVMTPHCRGGDGVAVGASFIGIMAGQLVITLLCGVGADSSLHTTTSLFYEGTFYPDTATFRTGISGILSYPFALSEGVITYSAFSSHLVTVIALFILVGR